MGFGWSSYVTQCAIVRACGDAGLVLDQMLAPELPAPRGSDPVFCVATDDVIILSNGCQGSTSDWAKQVDDAFKRHSLEKNGGKDVNDVLNGVAIGIELVDGLRWEPPAHGMLRLLLPWLGCLILILPPQVHFGVALGAFSGPIS